MISGQQRGQTLPLVAIALLVLLGVAGFAVDAGYHQYHQRMQQTATDSAALAGAAELNVGDHVAAARKDASLNGYTDSGQTPCTGTLPIGTVCVAVNSPPTASDAYAGNTKAVEVDITVYHPTFFESLFGFNNVPVTTKAVAVLTPQSSPNCVYVLSGNANFNAGQNGGTLSAHNCGFVFNDGANFNNAIVDAASLGCAVNCSLNAARFVTATPRPIAPESDPCASLTYCAHLAGYTPPTCSTTYTAPNNYSGAVAPGCYSGMDLHKATSITFTCGLYVIEGTLNASATGNSPPITITQQSGCGVTFFVTGSGAINMRNDNINLSAPASGDYSAYSAGEQNALVYQTPSDTNSVVFQSASCSTCQAVLNGMVYAPSANLNFNQGNTTTGGAALIIVGTLNFNGTNTGVFNSPGGPTTTTDIAILGE